MKTEKISILAIDVGTGTQDILLYESGRSIENCEKMVMPSKTVIVGREVDRATAAGHDILLTGSTMGGGPCTRAIRRHLNAGFNVYATPAAAKTIHDDLTKVEGMGVRIVGEGEWEDAVEVRMGDVDVSSIGHALSMFDVVVPQRIAVAVQDHGESTQGNRICRFKHLKKAIDAGGGIGTFTYPATGIPSYLTRMQAVAHDLAEYDVTLMDTGAAAIFGAMLEVEVAKNQHLQRPHIVVNIGNGHTLGAIFEDGCIKGCFEHHTSSMTGKKIMDYVKMMIDGTLNFDDVYNDGGHGCYIKDVPSELPKIVVTGPRRAMMNDCKYGVGDGDGDNIANIHFAAPYGDMMLTGCFGLLRGCGVDI